MRIGVDLGGTKIEAVVLGPDAAVLHRERVATPRNDYEATVQAIAALVARAEQAIGAYGLPVGCGTPGAVSPADGYMKNCNSTWLNGRNLQADLERALQRPVRLANDADCLALSEAQDGAAAGAASVFAAILGTGVGGGIVVNGELLQGRNAIAGEWGHNPLPWPTPAELPGPACWCGRQGCIETWLSGPGLAADHLRTTGHACSAEQIAAQAGAGNRAAQATLARHAERLARALAAVVNLLDPEVIVLGGGLSRLHGLAERLPGLWAPWIFCDTVETQVTRALHGDASGVRGAAWLWPEGGGTDLDPGRR